MTDLVLDRRQRTVPEGLVAALVTLAVGAACSFGPPPWSALGGLLVGGLGLIRARRRGEGPLAGFFLGLAVAPSVLPILVEAAFLPFHQPEGAAAPPSGDLSGVLRLAASLGATSWASLVASGGLPLAFGWVMGHKEPRTTAFDLPISRVAAWVVLLALGFSTVAELAAFAQLAGSLAQLGLRGGVWGGPVLALTAVVVFAAFRGATWHAVVRHVRRGAPTQTTPLWASALAGGLVWSAALLPSVWVGLAAALGPVDGIVGFTQGGAVDGAELGELYALGPRVALGGLFWPTALLLALEGGGRLLRARRAP